MVIEGEAVAVLGGDGVGLVSWLLMVIGGGDMAVLGGSKKNKGLKRELSHLAIEEILSSVGSPHQVTRASLKTRNNLASEPGMADSRQDKSELEMSNLIAAQERRFDRKFQEMMASMQEMFAAVNTRLDNVSTRRERGENSGNNHFGGGKTTETSNGSSFGMCRPKVIKMDFPRFNGEEDPTSWSCRTSQFFDYHQISEEERVPMASWNLEGDAQLWYQLLKEEHGEQCITWQIFIDELFERFGPTRYQDCFGELTKLQQTGTVKEYQTQFSRLLLRAGRLLPEQQVGCFVSGLKESLKADVQACKPATLSAAVGLARLYEARNQHTKKIATSETKKPTNYRFNSSSSSLPVKRLTPAELSERRAKGLCFNCNEKFGPGHRCKKLFLIEGCWSEDEEEKDDEKEGELETNEGEEVPEISIHAMCGAKAPQTMRVKGKMGARQVTFLIDSGSTHNFLNDKLATKIGLIPNSEGKFEVSVANGEKLCSSGRCKGVSMVLQGVPIMVDLYLLPLEGCDAVLGAQWLSTLGRITWDFSKLQMSFKVNGKEMVLNGLKSSDDRMVDAKEFSKDFKKKK
ncbi:hypothetical protein RJ640_001316 [Escallonia rubra]|uniref:Ty3 transposon capsid-like protein domain-containing protein n=1 Tax=Escallonia rubra TaxID=112253 RepID=A0AA88R748_9ASTE|nr:hypothetical protein RJ640_001316 [Escallonia rubra]